VSPIFFTMGCSGSGQSAGTTYQAPSQSPTLLADGATGKGRRLTVNGMPDAKKESGRRLTVNGGLLGAPPKVALGADKFSEDERAAENADLVSVLQSLNPKGKHGCAVCSSVTDLKNLKDSFKNKPLKKIGSLHKAIAIACKKGLKPTSPNQDSFSVLQCGDQFNLYVVCDGHGADGHIISNIAVDMLSKYMLTDAEFKTDFKSTVTRSFVKTNVFILKSAEASGFDCDFSGCTGTVVYHDKVLAKLTMAHAGDSGCCVVSTRKGEAKALITDHKPEQPEEKERIEKAGGSVRWDGYANHRVYAGNSESPGMNMSRALGDDYGHRHAGIICEPTVSEFQLSSEDFLCVCSDGVWEFLDPPALLETCAMPGSLQVRTEKLAKRAWDNWIKEENGQVVDDITAIVVQLGNV